MYRPCTILTGSYLIQPTEKPSKSGYSDLIKSHRFRLGAGRSQVQILSPRLAKVLEKQIFVSAAIPTKVPRGQQRGIKRSPRRGRDQKCGPRQRTRQFGARPRRLRLVSRVSELAMSGSLVKSD